jgi:spermidine synthase
MLKKLLFLSFIEGAAVMAAELCGARLLAPIFGSSLYVWATVMAVTLAALAAGYFAGGRLSRTSKIPSNALYSILIAASLFLLLMPVFSFYLIPRISYLAFLPAVILSTVLLLFFPVVLLGASSPLFIRLQSGVTSAEGHVSGMVYAVSTAGGIISTFVCGFYLIPELGLRFTMICFGAMLLISVIICLRKKELASAGAALIILYLNYQIGPLKAGTSDSILGKMEITDVNDNGTKVRLLKINYIIQSELDLTTGRSRSAYVQLLDSLVPQGASGSKGLVLGLGAGLTANMLVRKNYAASGVEFDHRIISAATNSFYLDSSVETVCDDARYFINQCNDKFDVILADLFKAEEQPSHVFTFESLQKVRTIMNPGCLLFITWHGFLESEKGEGTRILLNTLRKAGFNYQLHATTSDELSRNIIIVAGLGPLNDHRSVINENERSEKINTDDQPLLEKYNARANKAWRTQYLRYYQGKAY